jgi:hypothetical protein
MVWWEWLLIGVLITAAGVCMWAWWDARRIYRNLPPDVRRAVDEWNSPWTPRDLD